MIFTIALHAMTFETEEYYRRSLKKIVLKNGVLVVEEVGESKWKTVYLEVAAAVS